MAWSLHWSSKYYKLLKLLYLDIDNCRVSFNYNIITDPNKRLDHINIRYRGNWEFPRGVINQSEILVSRPIRQRSTAVLSPLRPEQWTRPIAILLHSFKFIWDLRGNTYLPFRTMFSWAHCEARKHFTVTIHTKTSVNTYKKILGHGGVRNFF